MKLKRPLHQINEIDPLRSLKNKQQENKPLRLKKKRKVEITSFLFKKAKKATVSLMKLERPLHQINEIDPSSLL